MKIKSTYASFGLLAFFLIACNSKENNQDEILLDEVISVKTYKLTTTDRAFRVSGSGILGTQDEARYSFKLGGVIDRIFVNEGEEFQKGQLLAQLKLVEIESGETQAMLGLEKAQRDFERVSNLFADSVATLEQLQNSRTALELATKDLEAVRFNKEYAFIYARNHGYVSRKLANEGEVIGGGVPLLAVNENSNQEWVLRVGLSDRDWAQIEIGNPSQVILAAFPNQIFEGKVFRKSAAADQGSGSFQVEIKLKSEGSNPAIGMFGKALIETAKTSQIVPIPYDALIEADGKYAFVFVPDGDTKVKKLPIIIENFDREYVNVRRGLENIQQVIISNSAFLNESSTINIIN
jgi:RND family efflux transporter MFP subunit